jgi:hypothetical protein
MNRYLLYLALMAWVVCVTVALGFVAFGELVNRSSWPLFLAAMLVVIPVFMFLITSEMRVIFTLVRKLREVRRNAKKPKDPPTRPTVHVI